jgi:phospholipase/carboxylesterase
MTASSAHLSVFIPGASDGAMPVLLLHGSGGTEQDLLPLGRILMPLAPLIAIRGGLKWENGFAFFRRFDDRRVDEVDLRARAVVLAEFIAEISGPESSSKKPIVIGFSNGAIMAAALVLMRPELFSAAVLYRPLPPQSDARDVHMHAMPILILDGERDRRRMRGDGRRLAERFCQMGARVTHHVLPVGHSITPEDIAITEDWLRARDPPA